MSKELIINNHIINKPMFDIIKLLQSQLINGKLKHISNKGEYITVTCPWHNNGHENRPSCSVYCGDSDLEYGWTHCFTCGESGPLSKFVGECFDKDKYFGEQWLIKNFGEPYNIKKKLNIPVFTLKENNHEKINTIIDESILDTFESYHPYMSKRHLTDYVIKNFDIKYDPQTKCIVFPVRDKHNNLIAFTRRSVEGKQFIIDKNFNKSNIYLLNNVYKNNYKEVYVVESQINALTLEGWGYHSIALFGAGTTEDQINELNRTGIKHYILLYDNDPAGHKGEERFRKFIRKDVLVDTIWTPPGKDINDLTKQEFDLLLK